MLQGRSSNRDILDSVRRGRSTLEEKVNNLKNHLTDAFSQIQVLEQLEKLVSQNSKLDQDSIEIIIQEFNSIGSIKEDLQRALITASKSPVLPSSNSESVISGTKESEITTAQKQITMLKASRDKLLFELDHLSVELDFHQSNHEMLKEQCKEHQLLTVYWKQQYLASIKQIENLKDMLEESAESCLAQKLPEGEILNSVAKQLEKEQEQEDLNRRLIDSEQRNKAFRESWLPALRQMEVRLMELNSAATDAFD